MCTLVSENVAQRGQPWSTALLHFMHTAIAFTSAPQARQKASGIIGTFSAPA
jgi:hypothetical protein